MYQGSVNELDFGLVAVVGADCSIKASISDANPPCFVFGSPSCNFELYFDTEALREFVPIANKALTTMETSRRTEEPDNVAGHDALKDAEPTTIKHLSWAWINKGCHMDFIVSSSDSMFFRFGASAKSFEPRFHIHALRRFVNLLREVHTQVEPMPDQALVGAGS